MPPVNRAIRVTMGTTMIKLSLSMASGFVSGSVTRAAVWAGHGPSREVCPVRGRVARGNVPVAGGRQHGRIGARRRRRAGWFADFGVAATGVHHDPPGFPAVQVLVASPAGQRVADDPGEEERQAGPASTSTRNIQVTV